MFQNNSTNIVFKSKNWSDQYNWTETNCSKFQGILKIDVGKALVRLLAFVKANQENRKKVQIMWEFEKLL